MTWEESARERHLAYVGEEYNAWLPEDKEEAREDFLAVLSLAPKEVPVLLEHMKTGQINGSYYTSNVEDSEGGCCLLGTLAEAKAGHPLDDGDFPRQIETLMRAPDCVSPAEAWFLLASPGDTDKNNPFLRDAVDWTEEWLREQGATT